MWDDRLYISPNYTVDDYLRINLRMNSSEEDWGTAIDILVDRIKGRYLDVIIDLLKSKNRSKNIYFGNSFSVMAIHAFLLRHYSSSMMG